MQIQQLKYFLSAARTLNFTRTAESFFISQSAVTQQIHNLEEELQVKLFSRHNRKLALTDVGRMFIPEAEGIIAKTSDAIQRVRAARDGRTGSLSIGYLQSMEMSSFPKSIQDFHNEYPGVHISLHRDDAVSLHDRFVEGDYDVIFNIENNTLHYHNVRKRRLGAYRYFVVMPPGHPLTRNKLIKQEELEFEDLIIHDLRHDKSIRSAPVPRNFLDRELMPNVRNTEDDVETILIMVASGLGLAILPEFEVHQPQINLNLIYVPLDTGDARAVISSFVQRNNGNPIVPLFMDYV
ncbi:MAG: LysR family transcriptional regulator [Anaerovoracaceae bacterium]|jgi:LysR family transcriptional activator of glutamate synthase operon